MAKLKINGQSVTVDDSFLSLPPDQQNATVDEISKSLSTRQGSTGSGVPAAPVAEPENAMQGVARAVRGGIPFGDRMAAAGKTVEPHVFDKDWNVAPHLGNGQGYGENLANERARAEDFSGKHPIVSAAGNIAGALSTIPMLPARVAGAALTAPSIGGKVLGGAGLGAGFGALQGISDSPDLTAKADTAVSAGKGAAGGALLGAMLPVAGKIVGTGYSKAADYFRPFGDGVSAPTGRSILRDFGKAGPGEIEKEINRLGPDAMLVDAAPSLLSKGQGVIENSRDARNLFTERLTARDDGTSNRLLSDFEKNIGKTPSKATLEDALVSRRKEQEAKDFGKALGGETPPVDVSELSGWLENELKNAGPSRK